MKNDNFEKGEDIIAGRNPVSEALKSGRSIERILVAHGEMSGSVKVIVAKAKERVFQLKKLIAESSILCVVMLTIKE